MKRKRIGRRWRHVYPYICIGCGKKRIAFMHDRAAAQICTRCEIPKEDARQGKLFNGPS